MSPDHSSENGWRAKLAPLLMRLHQSHCSISVIVAFAITMILPLSGWCAEPTPSEKGASAAAPKTEIQKWLEQVGAQYEAQFQRQVVKPYEAGVAQLKKAYVVSIDRSLDAATKAAKLEDAVALRAERARAGDAADVPPNDSDLPHPSVQALRAAYRAQSEKLEQARIAGAKAQFELYDKALAAGQDQLTQHRRLDDALLVKARREQVASVWLTGAMEHKLPVVDEALSAVTTASKDAPFVSSLGLKFVPVPIVGGPTDQERVLFSIWQTRVQDYELFVKETKREWPSADFLQGRTHPAVNVSWEDAQAFCRWLTGREHTEGRLPAGWSYRLPSDHEWSCAAELGERESPAILPAEKSGKITDVFPWGSVWPPPPESGNFSGEEVRAVKAVGQHPELTEILDGYQDGFVETAPVGSFKPNRFGLFDLGSNVWEWCQDWFDAEQKERVQRGASWRAGSRNHLLLSRRGHFAPDLRHSGGGFRCVVTASAR